MASKPITSDVLFEKSGGVAAAGGAVIARKLTTSEATVALAIFPKNSTFFIVLNLNSAHGEVGSRN